MGGHLLTKIKNDFLNYSNVNLDFFILKYQTQFLYTNSIDHIKLLNSIHTKLPRPQDSNHTYESL